MSHDDVDGEVADVNPALLELTKDPNAWREQRRRAMKAKIFGHDPAFATTGEQGHGDAQQYLPPSVQEACPAPTQASSAATCRDEAEANVLQQILSHKRRREERAAEATAAQPVQPSLATFASPALPAKAEQTTVASQQPPLSVKERLLQKYKKQE